MPDTMHAAVLHGIEEIRYEEVPRAAVDSADRAVVRIEAVGVCGSDLHFYHDGRVGDFVVTEPLVLGHEAAGEVVAVGEAVSNVRPGDRVAIEPGAACGRCQFCKSGRYNLCAQAAFLGAPGTDGAFCEYLAWPADFLFQLPDHTSYEEGAMIEPLAVTIQATRRAGVRLGDSVAILGAGPIGLVSLQAAIAYGATLTVVTDVIPFRLKMATKFGATHVLEANDDPTEAIMELTGGQGVDVVVDCVNLPQTIRQAMKIVRRGGRIQVIGQASHTINDFPVTELINKEISLEGVFRYANCYPLALAAIASGKVDVQSLITHRFPLAETGTAIAWVADNKDQVIKAVILPGDPGSNPAG